jgi:hypothetical protein
VGIATVVVADMFTVTQTPQTSNMLPAACAPPCSGDWQLLRSDIVMDVGNPINPAIDIGQVS